MIPTEPTATVAPSISGHGDPDGEAPWALQLVVRAEKSAELELSAVLEAAARAVVLLLDDPKSAPGAEWSARVERWLAGRIRKICRRARANAWERASQLDGVTATAGAAEVRAFVPSPVDEVPPELAKLQVQGLVASRERALVDPLAERASAAPGSLVVALNPMLEMSAGKAAAQVAHAANVAWLGADPIRRAGWADAGVPIIVTLPPAPAWAAFAPQAEFQIHDAGFTEIPAGSFTTAAAWT